MTKLLADNFANNYAKEAFDKIIFNNFDYKDDIYKLFNNNDIANYIYNKVYIAILESECDMLADNCFE